MSKGYLRIVAVWLAFSTLLYLYTDDNVPGENVPNSATAETAAGEAGASISRQPILRVTTQPVKQGD